MTQREDNDQNTRSEPDGPATVRTATRADLAELARVLGRAFHDDPVVAWLFPGETSRVRRSTSMFAALAREVHFGHEGIDVGISGGVIAGGAMWNPPDTWRRSNLLALIVQSAFIRSIGGRARRTGALLRAMDAVHPTERHWYLAQLGTDPAARGIGLGRALLDARLAQCDAAGLPTYLESSKERNIAYYQRFGFQVIGEVRVLGGPPVYPMWREPRRSEPRNADPDATPRA